MPELEGSNLETPPPSEAAPPVSFEDERTALRRRLTLLFVACLLAFTLATYVFVRVDEPFAWLAQGAGPARVVRAHLDALNRGELREAYDLFSPRFRREVSFEAFHQLVVSHRQMFRVRELVFSERKQSWEHAVLEARLLSAEGEHYRARFTLVHTDGRWWIDDLRWAAAPRPGLSISI